MAYTDQQIMEAEAGLNFLKLCPDYLATPQNGEKLTTYLREKAVPVTTTSLVNAYQDIKDSLDTRESLAARERERLNGMSNADLKAEIIASRNRTTARESNSVPELSEAESRALSFLELQALERKRQRQ